MGHLLQEAAELGREVEGDGVGFGDDHLGVHAVADVDAEIEKSEERAVGKLVGEFWFFCD